MTNRKRASALALSLIAATLAGPAAAQSLTVTDISRSGDGGFELSVPSVEAVDANLDEAAIRALFTEDFAESAPALATLDASSIRIPELKVAYDVPDENGGMRQAQVTYTGFELINVVDGVAGTATVESTEITGSGADTVIVLGSMSTKNLDIGAILGFYGLADATGAPGEMRTIYNDFLLAGGTVTSESVNCTIGTASAESFTARPLRSTFADLMKVTADLQKADSDEAEPSPESVAAIIDFYADFLTALRSSPTIFEGLTCDGTDPDGKAFALTAGPINVGGFEPGIYPGLSFDDVSVEASDGWFRLGNFTWKPMNVEDAIENLADRKGDISEEWLAANWRFLIPQFEGLSLSGMALDIPDSQNAGARLVASVGSFDLSLSDYVNGIPATILTSASGVEFAVPATGETAALHAMGVEKLSLSYDIAARWDRDNKTIAIEKLGFSDAELGGVSISGTLANAGPELFSERNEVALAAAMGLTATTLTIEVENSGALSLLIAAAAAEEKQQPQALQVAAAGMAQALPLAVLGGTPEAIALSNALGAFMTGTPNLTLTLTSTDPRGIGLAELMAAGDDPAALKGKVSIAAEVSGEPVPFVWPETTTLPAPPADPRQSGAASANS